jgi:hypothetical protein
MITNRLHCTMGKISGSKETPQYGPEDDLSRIGSVQLLINWDNSSPEIYFKFLKMLLLSIEHYSLLFNISSMVSSEDVNTVIVTCYWEQFVIEKIKATRVHLAGFSSFGAYWCFRIVFGGNRSIFEVYSAREVLIPALTWFPQFEGSLSRCDQPSFACPVSEPTLVSESLIQNTDRFRGTCVKSTLNQPHGWTSTSSRLLCMSAEF